MADEEVDSTTKIAFAAAIVLTLIGVAIDSGAIAWILAPFVLGLLFFVMSKVRLLYALLGVMFISLVIENRNEAPAAGRYASPFFDLGVLLMVHLNQPTGISWLSVSGTDMFLIF